MQPKVNHLGTNTAKLIYSCTKWDLHMLRVNTKNFMAMYKTLYQPYSKLWHKNKTISSNVVVCNAWCTGKINDARIMYKIGKEMCRYLPLFSSILMKLLLPQQSWLWHQLKQGFSGLSHLSQQVDLNPSATPHFQFELSVRKTNICGYGILDSLLEL